MFGLRAGALPPKEEEARMWESVADKGSDSMLTVSNLAWSSSCKKLTRKGWLELLFLCLRLVFLLLIYAPISYAFSLSWCMTVRMFGCGWKLLSWCLIDGWFPASPMLLLRSLREIFSLLGALPVDVSGALEWVVSFFSRTCSCKSSWLSISSCCLVLQHMRIP